MNKKVTKINKKKIKTRKTWTRSPAEQIRHKKRPEDEPFDENLYKGQKITEEDMIYWDREDEDLEEFERGLK